MRVHLLGKKGEKIYLYYSITKLERVICVFNLLDLSHDVSSSIQGSISIYVILVWRDPGVSLKGRISRLPEQPCWLYA